MMSDIDNQQKASHSLVVFFMKFPLLHMIYFNRCDACTNRARQKECYTSLSVKFAHPPFLLLSFFILLLIF